MKLAWILLENVHRKQNNGILILHRNNKKGVHLHGSKTQSGPEVEHWTVVTIVHSK
jgi:hypothetical protein